MKKNTLVFCVSMLLSSCSHQESSAIRGQGTHVLPEGTGSLSCLQENQIGSLESLQVKWDTREAGPSLEYKVESAAPLNSKETGKNQITLEGSYFLVKGIEIVVEINEHLHNQFEVKGTHKSVNSADGTPVSGSGVPTNSSFSALVTGVELEQNQEQEITGMGYVSRVLIDGEGIVFKNPLKCRVVRSR